MKKFFTLVAAAFVSVAMFASREVVPSDADLESYATKAYTMCIYNESACNDIVLIGTYVGWSTSAELEKFQAVEGFEGWYVATWDDATDPAADGGVQAKPVQLDGSGLFNWDYQLGADAELIRGNAELLPGNTNEVDIKNIGAGIVVIDVKSWKNNPCTAVYHVYNVALVSPDCNEEDYVVPAISGGFNGWAQQAMEMNELKTAERQQAGLPGAVFEVSFRAAEGSEFKFRSSEEWGKDWSNELKEYNAEEDAWGAYNGGANIVLGEETDLEFDLGDPELYSWNNCEKPVEEDPEYVIVVVNVPAGAPEAGVEIIGEFDGWTGTAMELLETGWYFAEIEAEPSQQFKFREAGSWDNEIVYVHKVTDEYTAVGLDNITFKDVWADDTWKGVPCKWIELDYSDADTYVWKANWVVPEDAAVEDIVLTVKAQKVVVDGVMYIVRDNKLFNVQGAQVR
jgi:hypothetical protein